MIAAQKVREEGAKNVGILDLDCHYGNGTDNIIRRLELENVIVHYTFGGERINRRNAEQWLHKLPAILARFAQCDVVLYQAGADPHVDDPLGGALTTEQLYDRDFIVFKTLNELKVPVAWNLAGGYQTPIRKVLDIHDNTARAFLAVTSTRHCELAQETLMSIERKRMARHQVEPLTNASTSHRSADIGVSNGTRFTSLVFIGCLFHR